MSGDGGLFLEACGASGPLQLEWAEGVTRGPIRRDFERPFVRVGSDPGCDLVIDVRGVAPRHAYFQMVEGRLFAVDLGDPGGLLWNGVPRVAGWVDRRRPVHVGPARVRIVAGDRAAGGVPRTGPGPTSRRFQSGRPLPEAVFEMRGPDGAKRQCPLEYVLTLVGRSDRCHLRLPETAAPRFVCALVRTPMGVWVVDLGPDRGVTLNGVSCGHAMLEDGDVLKFGAQAVRFLYDETKPAPPAVRGPTRDGDHAPALSTPPETELSLDVLLGTQGDQSGSSASPFGHALLMLLRLMGEVHRDHMGLVRDELEQIRRLGQEIRALQGGAARPAAEPDGEGGRPPETFTDDAPTGRPDPHVVELMVGERIAAWERERQSRWRKVLDLLVKP